MLKQLAIKELRESLVIVAIGTLAMLWMLSVVMNWRMTPWHASNSSINRGAIPFVSGENFTTGLIFFGGALAMAFGLWQTVRENTGKSFYFLLHRPMARSSVFLTKMLVGVGLLLMLTMVPTLVYACWAATPGNHASPFFWEMTTQAWQICLSLPTVYLGAMLSGIRPARWFGSRLLPLVAACTMVFLIFQAVTPSAWLGAGIFLTLDAVLIVLILKSAEQRDY